MLRLDPRPLLLRNPEVSRQFIRLLAGRVRAREQELLGMAYNSIRRRVADALLRLHEAAVSSGRTMRVRSLSPDVRRLLDLIGVTELLAGD